jgi:SAM-dependent methyltransferase
VSLRHHEIAEAGHRILDPFTDEKLRLLGEVARVGEGTRILDLACGKGELLCRWAEWFGATGIGVDISTVFHPAAVARARELGVDDRVAFVRADASDFPIDEGTFDVACCIGATWIGDGLTGTARMLLPAIRPGGLVLLGEPYWIDAPPDEAYEALGVGRDEFASLEGTLDRIEAAGLELVELVLADPDSWDRYEAAQWRTISDWLVANPDHPEHAAMADFLARTRRAYLAYGRRFLGWGVFVTRRRRDA